MTESLVGFIGLGNMGGPMSRNLADSGAPLVVYDAGGTAERAPPGAEIADSAAEVAARASVVFLCLPDGAAVRSVAAEIVDSAPAAVQTVGDTSTIGIVAARQVSELLASAGIRYVDSPVSGGVAGARAASLSCMYAGPAEMLESLRPLYAAMAKHVFHVGDEPGQGQAMKVLNNFLSGTAMAATAEAIAFGESQGLDMKTMLDVVHVSSGQNTAVSDKFPRRILTGTYDAGFHTQLFLKDLRLFHESAKDATGTEPISRCVRELWERFGKANPDSDFTRIYPFVKDKGFL
jgi:3-hydroxyisobutyrate dehydrogenase